MNINIQNALPRIRCVQYFVCEIFGKTFRGTTMAPGNQQKHLFLSLPTNA